MEKERFVRYAHFLDFNDVGTTRGSKVFENNMKTTKQRLNLNLKLFFLFCFFFYREPGTNSLKLS